MRSIGYSAPQAARAAANSTLTGLALLTAAFLVGLLLVAAPSARAEDNIVRTLDQRTITVRPPRDPSGLSAKTAIALDAETGRILWSRKATTRRLIASTTKIMTALVAISRTRPNEMLTATAYRAGVGESLLGLKPGEKMTAQDLIRGLLLESGNDAADTLAARTASSRAAFVDAMNRRARQLGLSRTHFANPVGLDSPQNYSTAADLAALSREALKVPRFANTVDRAKMRLRSGNQPRTITNRNPLVARYKWAVGVKTGHTLAAGYLLVGAAAKLDSRVISVVTGEPSEAARESDSTKLLKFGRSFYRPVKPLAKQRSVYALPVALQDITAKVYPKRDVEFAVRNGEKIAVRLDAPKELDGPRTAGSIVGTATVLRNNKPAGTVQVALRDDVPAPPTTAVMLHALGQILPWLLAALALCMLGTFLVRRKRIRTHRPEFVG
jgi:D-alanyl-D-alanine carboxypeptidase (penicillin-binding protein 5/6)